MYTQTDHTCSMLLMLWIKEKSENIILFNYLLNIKKNTKNMNIVPFITIIALKIIYIYYILGT